MARRLLAHLVIACLCVALSGCLESSVESPLMPVTDTTDTTDTTEPVVLKPVPVPVTLSGFLRYQDRSYNQNGFISANQPLKAIRLVDLELIDELGDTVQASITSATGFYQFDAVMTGSYRLRLKATAQAAGGSIIQVVDNQGLLYAVDLPIELTEANTQFDLSVMVEDRVAGIFNMLDVYQLAYQFVEAMTGDALLLDDLRVIWQWGQSAGSYTCRSDCGQGAGIYVLSDALQSGDTDEFDDDVLWHEFAHHLEISYGLLDSPGGVHTLLSTSLDLRLAFSEGMASFFATSLKNWLRQTAPQHLSVPQTIGVDLTDYYIDTVGSRTTVSLDLANASSRYRYATNEVAIAAVLIDLQDRLGAVAIWQTVTAYLTGNVTADTLESYWDGLVGRNSPARADLATWQSLLAARGIDYRLDALESNNQLSSATALAEGQLQSSSLFLRTGQVDEDWFVFAVTAGQGYRVATQSLRNGADTLIELFDDQGLALLGANGDALVNDDLFDCEDRPSNCSPLHDGYNFASELSFTAASTTTLYLRVTTSPSVYEDPVNYGYIGRYGSYFVNLASQP